MGKLLFALVVAAAIAGIFFVPWAGETAWQNAQRRGVPHAVARAFAHGVSAALRWTVNGRARQTDPSPVASRFRARRVELARAAEPQRPIDSLPSGLSRAPAASPDGIVAAPPKEKLSSADRAALDQLVSSRRAH